MLEIVVVELECHSDAGQLHFHFSYLRFHILRAEIGFSENDFAARAIVSDIFAIHIGFEVLKIGRGIEAHRSPSMLPVTADVMSAERYSASLSIEARICASVSFSAAN